MITSLTSNIICICPICSHTFERAVSAFDFPNNKKVSLICPECNTEIVAVTSSKEKYKMEIECPFCGDVHHFTMSKKNLWKKNLMIFNCPETALGTVFIGKDKDKLKKEYRIQNELIAGLIASAQMGDESIDVLYSIVEKINELAQEDKIECECKSKDIMINLKPDKIILTCQKCKRQYEYPITEAFYDKIENLSSITLK